MRYVATREGVDKRTDEWKNQKATEAQQDLIDQITKLYPASVKTLEYGYFVNSNTRGNASEFIASAIESYPQMMNDEGYLKYMATRPHVEKASGNHGLFSDSDSVLDLDEEVKKLQEFHGNVFTVIVSIKREDAERLGYANAKRWQDLLRSQIDFIAEQYKIPKKDLKWYAAFHDESHHPHIHMLLYSVNDESPGYINNKSINHLRHMFGTEIFADDLLKVYDRQTLARNRLTEEARKQFKALADSVRNGAFANDTFLKKFAELARRLKNLKGKKQYGYLSVSLKKTVDEVTDSLMNCPEIEKMYDIWYREKCNVYKTYTDAAPEKKPFSKEKEFKQVRNALVYEAVKLADEIHIVGQSAGNIGHPENNNKPELSGRHDHANNDVRKNIIRSAAIRFGASLARVFQDNLKKYDADDDDIDKKLRREIRAVKNGENLVM